MRAAENIARLKRLTGKTDGDLMVLGYAAATKLVEHVEAEDADMQRELLRSTSFVNWYYRQMSLVIGDYLATQSFQEWIRMESSQIWSGFEKYLNEYLISESGQYSYCHLMDEVITPQLRKRQKEIAGTERCISSPNI